MRQRRSVLWRLAGGLPRLCLVLLGSVAPAAGQTGIDDLYQANAIVTGTDMRQRPWGFAQCLREVLVKVSGDPKLRDDIRLEELGKNAAAFVAAFDYVDLMAGQKRKDDQGSYDRPHRLTVHFDPTKIDDVLAQFGDHPWRGPRPVIVPVLRVQGRKPPSYLLSAENPAGAEQRVSFGNAAGEFGMTARIPSEADLAGWGASLERLPLRLAAPPLPNSGAGEVIVVGTLDWNEMLPGWVGSWRTQWQGRDHAWGISGVNYDAAFRDIIRGVVLLASGRGSPD